MEENKNEDIETSENNEELEETEDESQEEETNEGSEDESQDDSEEELSKEEYEKLKEKNKQLYARLKKLESKKVSKEQTNKSNSDYLTRDEAILLNKGYDEDDINKLQRLAGNGSLIEASEDPLFVAYRNEKQRKEKSNQAQLSGSNKLSRGQKPISKMTEEEHKAFFKRTLK
jgi:hypothetical protein